MQTYIHTYIHKQIWRKKEEIHSEREIGQVQRIL